jgi:putative ubiquitin-RnfH superfamily antitoxin RatB of RatAB toxin-antitoxin module
MITIEVAYAGIGGAQAVIKVELETGSTVKEGIATSKILELECFPEFSNNLSITDSGSSESNILENDSKISELISELEGHLAIFGKLVTLDTELKNGDRIEILRPLLKNPMQARRERAKKNPLK